MKTAVVRSDWLGRDGRRFDAGPYTSGALETKQRLASLKLRKDCLADLTAGFNGGIYNGPQFARRWVDDPTYGVPFLGSSSMLLADLSDLPLLRRRDAESSKLSYLRISPGATLISCSGTIGRMVYTRPDMDGMWTSQHIMKVVPDPERVPPGYLYAFLSSRYGVPLVTSSTYGAIIQHIEPHHLADLPVPRLDPTVEQEIHELVESAAYLRAKAALVRRESVNDIEESLAWSYRSLTSGAQVVNAASLQRRLDGFHHSAAVASGRQALSAGKCVRLAEFVEDVFEPNRGPRMKVTDPAYGVPFLSSSEVFRLDPTGDYLISQRRTPQLELSLVRDVDVLVPRSGQIGGIIGRAVLPLPTNYGDAASEHLVRVRCHSVEDAHYVWAVLASQPGYYALVGTAYGSSIPSLDCGLIGQLSIPQFSARRRLEISDRVRSVTDALAQAIHSERTARLMTERAIEGAG